MSLLVVLETEGIVPDFMMLSSVASSISKFNLQLLSAMRDVHQDAALQNVSPLPVGAVWVASPRWRKLFMKQMKLEEVLARLTAVPSPLKFRVFALRSTPASLRAAREEKLKAQRSQQLLEQQQQKQSANAMRKSKVQLRARNAVANVQRSAMTVASRIQGAFRGLHLHENVFDDSGAEDELPTSVKPLPAAQDLQWSWSTMPRRSSARWSSDGAGIGVSGTGSGSGAQTPDTRPRRNSAELAAWAAGQLRRLSFSAMGSTLYSASTRLSSRMQQSEDLLCSHFHGLSIDLTHPYGTVCPNRSCGRPQSYEKIESGWSSTAQVYTTECADCGRVFVPRFVVSYAERDVDLSSSSGSHNNSGIVEMWCELLSPWVLMKEVQNILCNDGVEKIMSRSFRESGRREYNVIFWNLIVLFRRYGLPYTFLLTDGSLSTAFPSPAAASSTSASTSAFRRPSVSKY